MTKRSKAIVIAFALLAIAGASLFLLCYNQEGFTGSCVKNPDSYQLDIQRMNGTDLHALELQKGDVLQVRFQTVKGEMYLEIKAPDGASVYSGNGKDTTSFTVNISQDGVYPVVVVARNAKGSIDIQRVGSGK